MQTAELNKGAIFVVKERPNRTSTTLGGKYGAKGNVNTTQLGIKAYATIVKDGVYKQIAYDPILSSRFGIYTENWEMSNDEIDKRLSNLKKIVFNGGIMWTRPEEKALRDYLREYMKRPNATQSFYEVNPAKTAEEEMARDMLETKAKQLVYSGSENDVINYAMALGIKTNEDSQLGGHRRPFKSIQWDLLKFAEEDPEGFLNGWQDPATEKQVQVRKALQKGVITYDQTRNSINWRSNGNIIATAPAGASPVEHFAANVDHDEQYFKSYQAMVGMMEEKAPEMTIEEARDSIQDMGADIADDMSIGTLVEFALNQEVIETRAPKNKKGGVGYFVDGEKVCHLSKKDLLAMVEVDGDLQDKLRKLIVVS